MYMKYHIDLLIGQRNRLLYRIYHIHLLNLGSNHKLYMKFHIQSPIAFQWVWRVAHDDYKLKGASIEEVFPSNLAPFY